MSENYYLGLNVGSKYVGWATTDKDYVLCKHSKKQCGVLGLLKKLTLHKNADFSGQAAEA